MRTIKLNGHETPVIKFALNTTANPRRPQHESPPPQLKAEIKGKSDDAKRWNSAFHKWQRGAASRHTAAIEAWRKNREDIVSVMIEFPDMIVKWMRPRSKIPGRKKTFTINDIVEVDSKLHIHLRDGRDIGAGGIEMLSGDAVLRNELTVARMSKGEGAKLSDRQRINKQRAGKVTGNKLKCGSQEEVKKAVTLAKQLKKLPGKRSWKSVCEQALRESPKLEGNSGWRGLYYHVTKGYPKSK
jgi:hypothetical protein